MAKNTPKQLSYGTWGVGSTAHLGFESLNARLGTQMVHIPYKGAPRGPSYQAAMAGEIDVVCGTSFTELLKAGKLRPLAVGGSVKSVEFPNLPTLAELGLGDQMFGPVYFGIAAPVGTPKAVLDKVRVRCASSCTRPRWRYGCGRWRWRHRFPLRRKRWIASGGPAMRLLR